MRGNVGNRALERDQLRVIDLGDIDSEPMVNGGDEVEEVHRVNIDRLAQIRGRVETRQLRFRRDVVEFFLNYFPNVALSQNLPGSCKSLPISARNNAPACPSLTRWSPDSVIVITERGPIAPSITQGRTTALPIPTIATCGG